MEEFCLDLESKYRSTATRSLSEMGGKSPEWKVVEICMNLKLIDERKSNSELMTQRYNMRKKIEEELGKNSRRSRNKLKNLRCEAARRKKTVMMKNETKLKHLRRMFRTDEEEKINKIPDAVKDLPIEKLSIFDKNKYEEIKEIEYEVEIIGEVELTDNERMILRLPPKFAMEENLPAGGLAMD